MESEPRVIIDMLDPIAQSTITWSANSTQSFCDLSNLNNDDGHYTEFMALGLNETILDSSFTDTIPVVSFMSNLVSNINSVFPYNSVYVVGTFSSPQSFYTTTIRFGADYPKKIQIDYYDSSYALIGTESIDNIDDYTVFSSYGVTNCKRIKMTFLETWSPYRFVYLQTWLIGSLMEFGPDRITDCILNEETDPISRTIAIDTLKVGIVAQNDEFDVLNPYGASRFLKPGVPLEVKCKVNGNEIYFGKYYIKKINFIGNKSVDIESETVVGQLDNDNFIHSLYYSDTSVIDVINSIVPATISKEFHISNLYVSGYLPVMSLRNALKELCFACGISVHDSRSKGLVFSKYGNRSEIQHIYKSDILCIPDHNFEISKKVGLINFKVKRLLQVPVAQREDLITRIADSGGFSLSSPAYDIRVEPEDGSTGGATLLIPGAFGDSISYVQIYVTNHNKTYKITGKKYFEHEYKNQTSDDSIKDGESIKILDSTLLDSNNGLTTLPSRLFDFYRRYNTKLTIEYICTGQETGKNTEVSLPNNRVFNGILVHQSIDLAHGMVTSAEIYGGDS